MKKLFAFLLCICMLTSLLAGCGAKAEEPAAQPEAAAPAQVKTEDATPAEKIHITLLQWGTAESLQAQIDGVLADNPEWGDRIEVEVIVGGANGVELAEKLRLAAAGDEWLCDVITLNYENVPEFARAGLFADISDAVAPYTATMPAAASAVTVYDGASIAVACQVKPRMFFYRTDIFEECGVDVTAIKNTDDLIAAGLKIQETYPDAHIANLGHSPSAYNYFLTLSGNGASFFDENGNYSISTDPGTIACLEDYKKMVDAGVVMDVSDWTPDWEHALSDGSLVAQLSADWLGENGFLPAYSGEENRGKWACTLWPEIGGASAGSDGGGRVYAIPTSGKNQEIVAEFLAWFMYSEEGAISNLENGNVALPMNTDVMKSDAFMAGAEDSYFGTSYKDAQIVGANYLDVFNYGPNYSAESAIVMEYFTKAVYGEMSIEDALKAAEADMNTTIGNAYN